VWRGLCFLVGIVFWLMAKVFRLLLGVLFAAVQAIGIVRASPQAVPSSAIKAMPASRFVIGRYHWRTIALPGNHNPSGEDHQYLGVPV
jgi:hypothetical protein